MGNQQSITSQQIKTASPAGEHNKSINKDARTYKARSGFIQYKPSADWLQQSINQDGTEGFCLACGEIQDGVEPDAKQYKCESCNSPKVYGAEQLLLMGLFY